MWNIIIFCSAVQLSSPKLNFFIIAGCLLMYFSAFVQLLYTTNEAANHISCIVRTALPAHNLEWKMRVLTVVSEYRQTVAENLAISESKNSSYFGINFPVVAHLDVRAGLHAGLWYNFG